MNKYQQPDEQVEKLLIKIQKLEKIKDELRIKIEYLKGERTTEQIDAKYVIGEVLKKIVKEVELEERTKLLKEGEIWSNLMLTARVINVMTTRLRTLFFVS